MVIFYSCYIKAMKHSETNYFEVLITSLQSNSRIAHIYQEIHSKYIYICKEIHI